jgi:urocanate hydratase
LKRAKKALLLLKTSAARRVDADYEKAVKFAKENKVKISVMK